MGRRAGKRLAIDQARPPRRGGRRANFLDKWREDYVTEGRGKDKIKVAKLLALLAGPEPFIRYYASRLPMVVVRSSREDRDVKETHIYSKDWICLDPEDVASAANFRKDDGSREVPPEIDPVCILAEHVREMIAEDQIDLLDPVFTFTHPDLTDKTEEVTVRAGELTGIFQKLKWKDLEEEDAKRFKAAGIKQSEAWKTSFQPTGKYLIQLINYEVPEEGIRITREALTLGEAITAEVEKQMDAAERAGNRMDGHPFHNPYVIELRYYPNESWERKYDCVAMRDLAVSAELCKLVQEGPYPDMGRHVEYGNVKTLRAWLEQCAVIDLPWDDIFGPAEAVCDENGIPQLGEEEGEDTQFPPEDDEPSSPPPRTQNKPAAKPASTVIAEGVDEVPCDECGKLVAATAEKCPHCGVEYDLTEVPDDPAAPGTPAEESAQAAQPDPEPETAKGAKGGGKGTKSGGKGGKGAKGGGKGSKAAGTDEDGFTV